MTARRQDYKRLATEDRIVRRLRGAIFPTLLLVGVIGIVAVFVDTWQGYAQVQRLTLEDTRENLTDEMEDVFSHLRDLSAGAPAQTFAVEVVSLGSSPASVRQAQEEFIEVLFTLMERNADTYLSARYIDRNGTIWLEATSDETGVSISTDVARRARDPQTDPSMRSGLGAEFGTVAISALDASTSRLTGDPIPLMTVVSPIVRTGDLNSTLGFVELTFNASDIFATVRNIAQSDTVGSTARRQLLVDSNGRLLADSSLSIDTYLPDLNAEMSNFPPGNGTLVGLLNRQAGAFNTQALLGATYPIALVASADMTFGGAPTMPWRLVIVENGVVVLTRTLLLSLLVLGSSIVAGIFLSHRVDVRLAREMRTFEVASDNLRRLEAATQQAFDFAAPTKLSETLAFPADVRRDDPNDEGTQMMAAAQNIARQLEEINARIEAQTTRYKRNLTVAARISRETALMDDVDDLLTRAIKLISVSFGLYHAQVFLVDDANKNAVLVYSQGEAGQRLLDLDHMLPVGSQSVIGRVTATGEPVIVNDTLAAEARGVHAHNPLLKDTRAEMALPLQIGGKILGALDLQSNKPNVFQDEDLQTYQLLADQLAIAVHKTRLLQESEQRVQQIEKLNRQLTQMAWEELEQEIGLESVYRYNLLEVEAGEFDERSPYTTAQMLVVPIRVRGEMIGSIKAAPPDAVEFTQNDRMILQSVAERISLAIENARLFQETQSNLSETSTLYQTSRYLNEAEDMESIVEAIVLSAMEGAISGQVGIFDDYSPDSQPEWLEINATWFNHIEFPDFDFPQGIEQTRFHLRQEPLLQDLSSNQVTLVEDIERDVRLTPRAREWFRSLGARGVVFVPLSVRGAWRGTIIIEFPTTREFTERQGRIFNNLIDQAGVAIDNRLLLRRTESALEQNERLYAASRIINQATSMSDLVRAVATTADIPELNFGLALFEGRLDETGWSTHLHHVAQSKMGESFDVDEVYPVRIPVDSPLREREPQIVIVDAMEPSSALASIVERNDDHYAVIFPLFSVEQPLALFFVSRQNVEALSDENYEIFRALTGQMSTVIQNRRLLKRTEAALDETSRLYNASRAIADAQEINVMYDALMTHMVQPQYDVSRVSIFLAGPEPSYNPAFLNRVYAWLKDGETIRDSAATLRLEAATQPYSQMPPRLTSEIDAYPQLRAYLVENDTQSAIIAPMESRQNWLGVIIVESCTADAFDEQFPRFTEALADRVAIAQENQIYFERAQQEAKQALALAEASQLANQLGGDLGRSINMLLARVAETGGYDRWLLMRLDTAGEHLQLITQHAPEDVPHIAESTIRLSTANHPIADAVLFNRTLIENDVQDTYLNLPDLVPSLGKYIATPIVYGDEIIGALLVGRSADEPDLTERDNTLIDVLAAQIAVAMDNQRLFQEAETERKNLRAILNTLPAGVLVLDARTLKPVQYNAQIHDYLLHDVDEDLEFNAENYNLYRTGTNLHYPNDQLPVLEALHNGEPAFSDDVSIFGDDGHQIDLLVNAAPIRNAEGEITNIVAAFEDISNLRSLENTLQDNLRETIALYEATRSLSEADELDEVLDVVLFQLIMNEPEDAHVILLDRSGGAHEIARNMVSDLDIGGLTESILSRDRIVMINEIHAEVGITETDRVILRNQGVEAIATVPLRARQRNMPLGWIIVNYSQPHEFTPEDERFLSTLGDNAAVAIDNRYLFRSTQNALRETSLLYSATTSISRARDLNDLSQVMRASLESLSPDIYAGYLMTDPSSPDNLEQMFNVSMDGAPIDFGTMLTKYGLFREESILIEDVHAIEEPSAFEMALAELGTIRGFASVSLRVKGMPDGRLFLAYHTPHTFTDGESRYLNAIADSASVVVDNIILLDQIQGALEETSTLYQASRLLVDATSTTEILNVVVDKLIAPHIDQAFVALLIGGNWESPSASVQIVDLWQESGGLDLQDIILTPEQFPAWELLSSSSVVTVNDVQTDSRFDDFQKLGIQSLDARSLTVIPLRVPARAIGAVWISSREPHRHSEREERIFQAFAEQASLTLEASFLLEQTEKRARQLAISAEISQIVSAILDLDILLPQIVELVREEFNYDHVQVFLMDENNEYAELQASTGEVGRQMLSVKWKLAKGSQSVIGQVTKLGRPVVALDTADARVVHRPNPYLPLTRSEMALPILIKGRVIGALDVQSNEANAFGEDDIAVLTTLASQISVAIDNARLFKQAEGRADEMSFLFTITTAAASANSLEEALQNVVELLHGSLDALTVGIYLVGLDAETGDRVMRVIALSGADAPFDQSDPIPVGDPDSLIGTVSQDLIPVIVTDTEEEPQYPRLSSDARAAVIVPLHTGGEVTGVIAMESARAGAYTQDTLTLLLALGGTLAAIVDNARLLADISQKNEELRTLDTLKTQFLANMSHELRTPLNSIIGFSRVMLKGIDGPLTDMQEQDLNTIYNSGQHLLGLINDVLDQAKLAADKMDLQKEYFEISAVIEGVRSIGIGLVKEKPVDIRVQMANNLPQAYGDEFRTRQVLLNLISNAAKFTSEGNIIISVYPVEDDEKGTMIRIDVTDTGIGIDEKDLPTLFEAFRQVDSSLTRTNEGTGLGLPIAQSLVKLQGGVMEVQSELGVGSTFSLTIPTQPVEVDEEAILSEISDDDATPATENGSAPIVTSGDNGKPKPVIGAPPPGVFEQKRQILLIEDNLDMVDQYRRLLQREGFEVQVASDAFFAETMASGLRPTLIIMDVDFADGKGWDTLKNLKDRDDTFDIPIIVITLNTDSERAYRLGAHQFIPRPYMPNDLVEAVLAAEQESNIDRILIIDDQPESTRLIEEVLQAHGKYRVFAAHTGPEGISLVARRRPDLIVLDLRMPDMDGFAVLEELRSRPETASIPVVVVTGESSISSDEREKLTNLEIIYKTDLNQENYELFINEVRRQITNYHGK